MVLQGRGLFYGATHGSMNEATWDAMCYQASSASTHDFKTWGMQYVHPKVADRTGYWYTDAEMTMLRDVARKHGLICYPYYYITTTNWERQADMMAHVGSLFGGVIPDMEDEWFRQPQIAAAFGQRLRSQFKGLVIPTLYADPQVISQYPYAETLRWCDAWMPMAYFNVWEQRGMPMTAVEASSWLQPQWNDLNKHLVSVGIAARPILPLIATEHLPIKEVVGWLRAWHGILGYCGFWYDGTYPTYAADVLREPEPTWQAAPVHPTPTPTKPVPVPEPVRTSTPPPASRPPVQQEEQVPYIPTEALPANVFFPVATSGLAQHLSERELAVLWHHNGMGIPWNPQHALVRVWIQAVQFHPELGLGCPLFDEQHSDASGLPVQVLRLDSGHLLIYFQQSGRVSLTGGGTVLAGTLSNAGVFTPPVGATPSPLSAPVASNPVTPMPAAPAPAPVPVATTMGA